MKNIKFYFSFLIGLLVLVVFLCLRFRPKPFIPFYFDGFLLDPFLVIGLTLLFRKLLRIWLKNRCNEKKINFFYKFQLFVYYIINKRDDILIKIEEHFANRFPKVFFKLIKFCHEFILWNDLLLKSENFLKRLFGKFLLNFFILPIFFTFFLDVYLHVWHYIFWGILMSIFFHFIFFTLILRLGKYYVFFL